MMMPSCSVISDQSPWRQTFGYFSKYAARYLAPSGSFQNPIGIDGKGLVQTSSPFSPCTGLPCSSNPSLAMPRTPPGPRAGPLGLDLPPPHRCRRIAEHETGHDVGAPGDGRQANVLFDVAVDVVEPFGQERRTRGEHGAQLLQLVRVDRLETRLAERVDELGRGAEVSHALGVSEVEEEAPAIHERRAVVEQERRAGCEAAHQPVPHHPAERSEVEQAIAGAYIALQPMLLQVLQ